MTYRDQLREIAFFQHGVVTLDDADEFDVPAEAVRKLAMRGILTRIAQGVYRNLEVPVDQYTDYAQALAVAGPNSFLGAKTVLAYYDLAFVNPHKVEVVVPRKLRKKIPEYIKITVDSKAKYADVHTLEGSDLQALSVAESLNQMIPLMLTERCVEAVNEAKSKGLITTVQQGKLLKKVKGGSNSAA